LLLSALPCLAAAEACNTFLAGPACSLLKACWTRSCSRWAVLECSLPVRDTTTE
jgi:hypothetical protein